MQNAAQTWKLKLVSNTICCPKNMEDISVANLLTICAKCCTSCTNMRTENRLTQLFCLHGLTKWCTRHTCNMSRETTILLPIYLQYAQNAAQTHEVKTFKNHNCACKAAQTDALNKPRTSAYATHFLVKPFAIWARCCTNTGTENCSESWFCSQNCTNLCTQYSNNMTK